MAGSQPQIIPLDTSPNQTFQLSLLVNGKVLGLNCRLRFNEVAQYYVVTIMDLNNNVLLDSVPFVTGNAPIGNILKQFGYLGLGSWFIINASGVQSPDFPNNTDLGTDFVLLIDNNQS